MSEEMLIRADRALDMERRARQKGADLQALTDELRALVLRYMDHVSCVDVARICAVQAAALLGNGEN